MLSADDSGNVYISHWKSNPLNPYEASYRLQHSLLCHDGRINDLHVRPDGKKFLSCGEDGHIKLWDIQRPQGSMKIPTLMLWGCTSFGIVSGPNRVLDPNGQMFRMDDGVLVKKYNLMDGASFDHPENYAQYSNIDISPEWPEAIAIRKLLY